MIEQQRKGIHIGRRRTIVVATAVIAVVLALIFIFPLLNRNGTQIAKIAQITKVQLQAYGMNTDYDPLAEYWAFTFYTDVKNSGSKDIENTELIVDMHVGRLIVISDTQFIGTMRAGSEYKNQLLSLFVNANDIFDERGYYRGRVSFVITLCSGNQQLDQMTTKWP